MKKIFLISFILLIACSCSRKENSTNKNIGQTNYLPTANELHLNKDGLSSSRAIIKTVYGNIEIAFYPNEAPNTVTRIIQLIQSGFYDGLTFHKVIPNYIVQTGDPLGTGLGGSGIRLKAEHNNLQHKMGAVAIARSSEPDSADSQFYIALKELPDLDGKFTIFGQVTKGIDLLSKIRQNDKILQFSLRK